MISDHSTNQINIFSPITKSFWMILKIMPDNSTEKTALLMSGTVPWIGVTHRLEYSLRLEFQFSNSNLSTTLTQIINFRNNS